MLYNKRNTRKINDKKILHKIGKHWVAVSVAMLALMGVGVGSTSLTHASADATTPVANKANVKNANNGQSVGTQANQMYKQIIANNAAKVGATENAPQTQVGATENAPETYVQSDAPTSNAQEGSVIDRKDKGADIPVYANNAQHTITFGSDGNVNMNTKSGHNYNLLDDTNIKNDLSSNVGGGYTVNFHQGTTLPSDGSTAGVNSLFDGKNANVTGNSSTVENVAGNITAIDFSGVSVPDNVRSLAGLVQNMPNLRTVILPDNFITRNVSDISSMFYNDPSLTSIDFSGQNLSQVSNASSLFSGDRNLVGVKFPYMGTNTPTFRANNRDGQSTSKYFNGLNQGGVNLSDAFNGTTSLQNVSDLQNFDMKGATSAQGMFANSGIQKADFVRHESQLATDPNGLDINHVQNLSNMFNNDSNLRQVVSNNGELGQNAIVNSMFANDKNLNNVDLSHANLSNIAVNANYDMFRNDPRLTHVNLGNTLSSTAKRMFDGDNLLETLTVGAGANNVNIYSSAPILVDPAERDNKSGAYALDGHFYDNSVANNNFQWNVTNGTLNGSVPLVNNGSTRTYYLTVNSATTKKVARVPGTPASYEYMGQTSDGNPYTIVKYANGTPLGATITPSATYHLTGNNVSGSSITLTKDANGNPLGKNVVTSYVVTGENTGRNKGTRKVVLVRDASDKPITSASPINTQTSYIVKGKTLNGRPVTLTRYSNGSPLTSTAINNTQVILGNDIAGHSHALIAKSNGSPVSGSNSTGNQVYGYIGKTINNNSEQIVTDANGNPLTNTPVTPNANHEVQGFDLSGNFWTLVKDSGNTPFTKSSANTSTSSVSSKYYIQGYRPNSKGLKFSNVGRGTLKDSTKNGLVTLFASDGGTDFSSSTITNGSVAIGEDKDGNEHVLTQYSNNYASPEVYTNVSGTTTSTHQLGNTFTGYNVDGKRVTIMKDTSNSSLGSTVTPVSAVIGGKNGDNDKHVVISPGSFAYPLMPTTADSTPTITGRTSTGSVVTLTKNSGGTTFTGDPVSTIKVAGTKGTPGDTLSKGETTVPVAFVDTLLNGGKPTALSDGREAPNESNIPVVFEDQDGNFISASHTDVMDYLNDNYDKRNGNSVVVSSDWPSYENGSQSYNHKNNITRSHTADGQISGLNLPNYNINQMTNTNSSDGGSHYVIDRRNVKIDNKGVENGRYAQGHLYDEYLAYNQDPNNDIIVNGTDNEGEIDISKARRDSDNNNIIPTPYLVIRVTGQHRMNSLPVNIRYEDANSDVLPNTGIEDLKVSDLYTTGNATNLPTSDIIHHLESSDQQQFLGWKVDPKHTANEFDMNYGDNGNGHSQWNWANGITPSIYLKRAPKMDTDLVDYVYNGRTINETSLNGSDGSTYDIHAAEPEVNGVHGAIPATDQGLPDGYKLVNKNNNFTFDNGNHQIQVVPVSSIRKVGAPVSDTINYIWQGHNGTDGTTTINGHVGDNVVANGNGIDSGFQLANDGTQSFTLPSDDGAIINVDVVPASSKVAIGSLDDVVNFAKGEAKNSPLNQALNNWSSKNGQNKANGEALINAIQNDAALNGKYTSDSLNNVIKGVENNENGNNNGGNPANDAQNLSNLMNLINLLEQDGII